MRARGFSLIELLVAMAVSLIAIAAGVVLLAGSQRAFQGGTDERAMQEAGRVALEEIGSQLKEAGYGLEPTFVFDVGPIANTVMDRIPIGKQARFGGFACNNSPTCRDSITGSDELVFYSRDPLFSRTVTGVGANNLILDTSAPLLRGQILQVMCYGGTANQWIWAYVTVDTVAGTTVNLQPSTGLPYDFPTQNALLGEGCFMAGGAMIRAFKVDRYRYYIQKVDDAGNQVAANARGKPYLMLDQGLSNGNTPVVTAIAPDVEDLQVAYIYPLAADGAQVVGNVEGTRVPASYNVGDAQAFDLGPAAGIPSFTVPSLDPIRTTHHPANIRSVRLMLTVRSPRNDPAITDSLLPAALNRPANANADVGYHREQFDTTVYIRNMETRLPMFPYYAASCASNAGNCAGG
jgi:type IV pilus assembly protein PilW